MSKSRLPGTKCRIYVDGFPGLAVGDFIVTSGSACYFVDRIRQSPTIAVRRYLDCIRWERHLIPSIAKVWTLRWYRRAKGRKVAPC